MASVQIPLTTLALGAHTFGPTPAGGVQTLDLLINRTVGASPLNGQAASTTLDIECDLSFDAGATWQLAFTAHAVGGTYIDDETGKTSLTSQVTQRLVSPTPAGTLARAVVTVGGASVSVSGTLTVS